MSTSDHPSPLEAPVWLELNGEPLYTWLCTPTKLGALACGWMLGEGLIASRGDLLELDASEDELRVRARIEATASESRPEGLAAGLRASAGGPPHVLATGPAASAFSLERIPRGDPRPFDERALSERGTLRSSFRRMFRECALRAKGGGIHSGALLQRGEILHVSEDVGRHNVIDKVVGAAVLEGTPVEDAVVLLSGRISAEIAVKAWRSGVAAIATLSVPTSLAREIATRAGVTLVGRSLTRSPFVYQPGQGSAP